MFKVIKTAGVAVGSIALALGLAAGSAEAGTAVRLTVPEMVDRAEAVFEGRVLDARAQVDARGLVTTEYFVSVRETYWGVPYGTRTFSLPGGVLADGSGMLVPGMPEVKVGEDAIFFLTEQSPAGFRMPVGLAQGKFRLVTDPFGEVQLERDQEGLVLADPLTGAVLPADERPLVSYDQVVSTIRAAATAKTAHGQVVGEER